MKKIITLFIIALWFYSCEADVTPNATPAEPTVNQPVLHLPVINDVTPNSLFTINKGNLFQESLSTEFIFGIIDLTYNGSNITTFTSVTYEFYSSDNTLLYRDNSYLYNRVKKYETREGHYYDNSGMENGESAVLVIATGDLNYATLPNGLFTMQDVDHINIAIDTTENATTLDTNDVIACTTPVTYDTGSYELSLSLENQSLSETFTFVTFLYYCINADGNFIQLGYINNSQMEPMAPGATYTGTESLSKFGPLIESVNYKLKYSAN